MHPAAHNSIIIMVTPEYNPFIPPPPEAVPEFDELKLDYGYFGQTCH
jgi:hypothetical protein